jgi:uncharacterized protein
MGSPVVHFEIVSQEASKLHPFYSELFDWKIDTNNPMGYGMVDTGGEAGIPGGIGPSQDQSYQGHVTFYVQVPDPDAVLDKAEKLGGKTVMPTTELPGGVVTIAMFTDPAGNLVGLTKG